MGHGKGSHENQGRSKFRSIVNSTRKNIKRRKGHEKLDDCADDNTVTKRSYNTSPITDTDTDSTKEVLRGNVDEGNMMVPFLGPLPPPAPLPHPTSWTPFHSNPSPPRTATADASHRLFTLPSLLQSHRAHSHPLYPVQSRCRPFAQNKVNQAMSQFAYKQVGNPSLRIYRVQLPSHLIHILDEIVLGCEAHAATLAHGWRTQLYSLTKQDIALRDIPHLFDAAKPITLYIKRAMAAMMGVESVILDRNQPHILKYNVGDGHTGVALHHDKCDVTANMCLSRSSSYMGGGTFFPDAREVVRLEFGEFLLHPGSLVHAGMNIMGGTRHLMVLFGNKK